MSEQITKIKVNTDQTATINFKDSSDMDTKEIVFTGKEKITDEGIRNSNVKLIPKGTTLLSFKLSIGKTAIAGADLYTNEAIASFLNKTNTYLPFLYYSSSLIEFNANTNIY